MSKKTLPVTSSLPDTVLSSVTPELFPQQANCSLAAFTEGMYAEKMDNHHLTNTERRRGHSRAFGESIRLQYNCTLPIINLMRSNEQKFNSTLFASAGCCRL